MYRKGNVRLLANDLKREHLKSPSSKPFFLNQMGCNSLVFHKKFG